MTVFRAVTTAMGAMTNLAIILVAVWLTYAILGTQAFRGRFYACTDLVWGDQTYAGFQIARRDACLQHNFTWMNNVRNFDNIGESMLTLFGVATTDMWADVMFLTSDGVSYDEAPRAGVYPFYVLYCISFVVVVTFFLLNMTVSVLTDAYKETRRHIEQNLRRSLLHQGKISALNEEQQDFVDMYRRSLVFIKPPLRPPYGSQSWRQKVRRLVRKRAYDYVYVAVALASVVVQATAFSEMPPIYDDLLLIMDGAFTAAFVAAFAANVLAYGLKEYLSEPNSRFELIVNLITTAAVIARFAVGPNTIIDLLRLIRILRLKKTLSVSTGLRLFWDTLLASARTCAAVFALVFLVFFVYACVGMRLFSGVRRGDGITRLNNFERIDFALITLLRVATFDDWQIIMWNCAMQPPQCDESIGECGYPGWAQLYFMSFICVGQWIGLNFFTAILLDAFARSEREDRMAVQPEHIQRFRALWKKFSTSDTLPVPKLAVLIAQLRTPLGSAIGESAFATVAAFDNLTAVNNEVFQGDVFDTLMRHYYGVPLPHSTQLTLRNLLSATFRKRLYANTRVHSGWPTRVVAMAIRIQARWRARRARKLLQA
jgi:hypothetical protein